MDFRRNFSVLLVMVLIVGAGCATKVTQGPVTPTTTPPQVQVANAVNTLAQALDAAATAIQAAQQQGKVSSADAVIASKVIITAATTGKTIDAELKTSDDWPTMKTKILQAITQAGLQAAVANVPASAKPYMVAAITAYNTIASTVGGPTI